MQELLEQESCKFTQDLNSLCIDAFQVVLSWFLFLLAIFTFRLIGTARISRSRVLFFFIFVVILGIKIFDGLGDTQIGVWNVVVVILIIHGVNDAEVLHYHDKFV